MQIIVIHDLSSPQGIFYKAPTPQEVPDVLAQAALKSGVATLPDGSRPPVEDDPEVIREQIRILQTALEEIEAKAKTQPSKKPTRKSATTKKATG